MPTLDGYWSHMKDYRILYLDWIQSLISTGGVADFNIFILLSKLSSSKSIKNNFLVLLRHEFNWLAPNATSTVEMFPKANLKNLPL